jgi:hypothetical protein
MLELDPCMASSLVLSFLLRNDLKVSHVNELWYKDQSKVFVEHGLARHGGSAP